MGFCFCVGDNGRADIFVPFKKVKHRYFACSTASSFAFTSLSVIPLVDFRLHRRMRSRAAWSQ